MDSATTTKNVAQIRKGTRVTFTAGRGRSEGKVEYLEGENARITTREGKTITRKLAGLTRVAN